MTNRAATRYRPPPIRRGAVERASLFEQLDRARHVPLVLVSAPAGYGKTTSVIRWLGSRSVRAGWVSVTPAEADERELLASIAAAMTRAGADFEPDLERDLVEGSVEWEFLADALVEAACAHEEELLIVLDDLHHAGEIGHVLDRLLRHPAPNLHFIVSTRNDPRLPLPRLRARAEMVEIREQALSFDDDEAGAFLRTTMGLDISDADVATLCDRTQGWPAGLQLAALSLGHGGHGIEVGAPGSRRIDEYLFDEVLDGVEDAQREILLRLSILPGMTPGVVEVLTGTDDGQALLRTLEGANLFVTPIDRERTAYRFHRLFGDLLQRMARSRFSEEQLAGLHRQAAQAWEREGEWQSALDHALDARWWDGAAELLERYAYPLLVTNEIGRVRDWIARFPGPPPSDPRVATLAVFLSIISGEGPPLFAKLAHAQELTGRTGCAALSRRLATISGAIQFHHNQLDDALESFQTFFASEPGEHPAGLSHLASLMCGFGHYYAGDVPSGNERFAGVAACVSESSRVGILYATLAALLAFERGEPTAARAALLRTVHRDDEAWHFLPRSSAVAIALVGQFSVCAGDLDDARQWLERGRTLTSHARFGLATAARPGLAALVATLGLAGWREDLAELRDALVAEHLPAHTAQLDALRLGLELDHRVECDEREKLARQYLRNPEVWNLDRGLAYGGNALISVRWWQSSWTFARALAWAGELEAAARHGAQQLARCEREGRLLGLVDYHLHLADVALRQGAVDRARESVRAASDIAAPRRLIAPFLEVGGVALELARELAPEDLARRIAPAPAAECVLSERELEVLAIIATGASTNGAAERLFVAPSTVKKHLEHIYDKLGVRSRTGAVAEARRLELLD